MKPSKCIGAEAHRAIERRLKSVSQSAPGLQRKVGAIRLQLADWSALEQRQSPDADVPEAGIYFNARAVDAVPLSAEEVPVTLVEVRRMLAGHYPACDAMTGLLRRIDAAVLAARAWTQAQGTTQAQLRDA